MSAPMAHPGFLGADRAEQGRSAAAMGSHADALLRGIAIDTTGSYGVPLQRSVGAELQGSNGSVLQEATVSRAGLESLSTTLFITSSPLCGAVSGAMSVRLATRHKAKGVTK